MKIYLVERTDKIDWDEYDSFVVVAESDENARKLVANENGNWSRVTEIIPDKERIVLGSFNAG